MFERNADNYTLREQARLQRAHVAVCGLGGGGGYVAEVLARVGVGRLTLIDGDRFEDSNRNRQIGALGSTLGRLKVEVMAERLRDVSPYVEVDVHPVFLGPDSAPLLTGADVVCDCVDGDNKLVLASLCRLLEVPYCTGGLSGSCFHVAMFDDPNVGASLYTREGPPSLQADPTALLLCAGLQARGILAWLLGRDTGTLNREIMVNCHTFALSVEDVHA